MRYYITGKVVPERCAVSIDEIKIDIKDVGSITFNCDSSQISVIIDNTKFDQHSAIISAKEISSMIVSCIGFANGCGYSVEMINICDDNKLSTVYGVGMNELISSDISKEFKESFKIACSDLNYRFSIRDFTKALVSEFECPFLCYRAIETIKSKFYDSTLSDSTAWENMHKKIGSNSFDITSIIKPLADPIRHGNYSKFIATNREERVKILNIAKDIINKYKQYLMKNNEV